MPVLPEDSQAEVVFIHVFIVLLRVNEPYVTYNQLY